MDFVMTPVLPATVHYIGPMQFLKTSLAMALVLATSLLGAAVPAAALEIKLERPGDREFIRDLARMLDPAAETRVRGLADKLLNEKATPIIVVTIDSMANHGGEGMSIESFSTILFNQWEIGHARLGDQDWNTGILLLVSKGDRKARIELGGGWDRSENATAHRIMSELIVPRFKEGLFAEGIVAGVEGLDAMARKLEPPRVPRPASHYLTIAAFVGLAIFTGVSLYRRGSSGWAWFLWSLVFSAVGLLLMNLSRHSSSRSYGGSGLGSFDRSYYGGSSYRTRSYSRGSSSGGSSSRGSSRAGSSRVGSYGGGTSGGGGATGEW